MVAIAGLGATAAPSMAYTRVATTTTVSASPSVVAPAGSSTLTASILPGFLIGPLGNATFTDSTNGAVLGTVKPGLQCILRRGPCIVTLTVQASALAAGDNTVVAAYSGGLATKPSSGSTDVFVGTQNTCPSGGGTCNTNATSSDGSTSTAITSSAPSSGTETVQAYFTSQAPACTKVGAGDTLVYSVTNPGSGTKTVTLTLTGAAADAERALDPNSWGNVCFGATSPFETSTGGQAKLGTDGLYYGDLPLCDDGDGDDDNLDVTGNIVVDPSTTLPCINYVNAQIDTWATYTPAAGSTPSTYTESFTSTASDPRAHG